MKNSIEINELPPLREYKGVIPEPEKFYYIDYQDVNESEGSYFGIAKCVRVCDVNGDGERLIPPLYEFLHPTPDGSMALSLFYGREVVMETKAP